MISAVQQGEGRIEKPARNDNTSSLLEQMKLSILASKATRQHTTQIDLGLVRTRTFRINERVPGL